MRYAKSIRQLVSAGSRNLIDTQLRKRLQPSISGPSSSVEHPIMMMHGFMGFSQMKIFNITLFEYFNGVQALLEQMGYKVYAPSVTPISPPLERAEEWGDHLNQILAETGAKKVHLIGHSQGGIDARVLAAPEKNCCTTLYYGDLHGLGFGPKIATITALGSPHEGTPLAEFSDGGAIEDLMMELVGFIAMLTGSSKKTAKQAVESLSRSYMQDVFNQHIKVPNSIACYTVAGVPASKKDVSFILEPSWKMLNEMDPSQGGGANDGLVPAASAHFETSKIKLESGERQWQSLGDIDADHVAMVGIPVEDQDEEDFSHLTMFAGLAQNIDACYRENITLALQPTGEWLRSCKPKATTTKEQAKVTPRSASSRTEPESA